MGFYSISKKALIPLALVLVVVLYFERKSSFLEDLEQSRLSKTGTSNVKKVAKENDPKELAKAYKRFRSVGRTYEKNIDYNSSDIKDVIPILDASIGHSTSSSEWWAEKEVPSSNKKSKKDVEGISALSKSRLADFERVLSTIASEETKAIERSEKTVSFGSATKEIRRVGYRTAIDVIVAQNEVSWHRSTVQWTLNEKIHGVSVRNSTDDGYGGVMRDCDVIFKSLEYEGINPYAVSTSEDNSESLLWVTEDGSTLYMYRAVFFGGESQSCRISYFDKKLSTYLISINANPKANQKSISRSLKNLQISLFTDY